MQHILAPDAGHLAGDRMGEEVPHLAGQVQVHGHIVRRQGDQFHGQAAPGIPVDPGVGVSPEELVAHQQPPEVEGGHGLVGPLPQHPAQMVIRHPLLGSLLHDVDRQHRHGGGQQLHAPVDCGDLHGPVPAQTDQLLTAQPALRVIQGQEPADTGQPFPDGTRLPGPRQSFPQAHFSSPAPHRDSTAPAMARPPPVIRPAGR